MARVADHHTVVVGVDGSAEGAEALRYAVGAARSRGMWLLVVHAYQLPPHGPITAAAIDAAALASAHRVPADALSQVVVPADLDVQIAVELTTPLLMLRRLSGQVALIVVGQHTADSHTKGADRPVSSILASSASCPTVIVPPGWRQHRAWSQSILVGLDAETLMDVVLDFACAEAERRGWSVTALQALAAAAAPASRLARSANLDSLVAGQRRDRPAVPLTVEATMDSLAQVIHDGSRQARLVVVGRPGTGSSRPGAWSSRAAGPALEDLPCPLVIVPGRTGSPAA